MSREASEKTGTLQADGLVAAARSDRGRRERNEDAFVCCPEQGLFAVIDGMGGQQGGATAAALARGAVLDAEDPAEALLEAARRIRQAALDPRLKGMGCVASAVRVLGSQAHVAHVGDTRVYLASRAGCEILTRDHTMAAVRQEQLGISEREARGLAGHNQVTRDLGGTDSLDEVLVDELTTELEPGDLLLLCSDGLHGAVPVAELVACLRRAQRENASLETLVDHLVERALDSGVRDNVTVVAVRRLDTLQ